MRRKEVVDSNHQITYHIKHKTEELVVFHHFQSISKSVAWCYFDSTDLSIKILPINLRKMTTNDVATADVVIIEWDDLMLLRHHSNENKTDVQMATKMKHVQDAIDQSYGSSNGIGIMAIRGVPNFVTYKDQFLIQAHALATKLTEDYREMHLTDKSSLYNAGWSYGKEQLGQNKPPDTSKGSFYYNPVTDTPGTAHDRELYP
jgi:hypothetical protein